MTRTRRILFLAGAVVLAFALGFSWQYMRAEALESRLQEVEAELAFARLEATLGAAALEAQRGSYESARKLASEFYTGLQRQVEQAAPEAEEELTAILSERDRMITLLSRAEPEGREALLRAFARYRVAVGGPERALAVPPGNAATSPEEAATPQ